MPRFLVTDSLLHDGRPLAAGDEVEMSQAEAEGAALYGAVDPTPLGTAAPAPKAPRKRAPRAPKPPKR